MGKRKDKRETCGEETRWPPHTLLPLAFHQEDAWRAQDAEDESVRFPRGIYSVFLFQVIVLYVLEFRIS
jgi:hypothetical protein